MRHYKKASFAKSNRSKSQSAESENKLGLKRNKKYLKDLVKTCYSSSDLLVQVIPYNLRKSRRISSLMMDVGKKVLKVSSFTQTNTEVHLELHLGRRVQSNEIQVTFHSENLSIGLTSDGRTFNCTFPHPIVETKSRVQLRKVKLLIVLVKADEGLEWKDYNKSEEPDISKNIKKTMKTKIQKFNDKIQNQFQDNLLDCKVSLDKSFINLSSNATNTQESSASNVQKDLDIKNFPAAKSWGDSSLLINKNYFAQDITASKNLASSLYVGSRDVETDMTSSPIAPCKLSVENLEKINKVECGRVDVLNGNVTEIEQADFHTATSSKCEILTMHNKDNHNISLPVETNPNTSGPLFDDLEWSNDDEVNNDLLLQCYSVETNMDLEQNEEITSTTEDIRLVTDLKIDYTEMENKITVYIYVRGVQKQSLVVHFNSDDFSIDFFSTDAKFLAKQAANENTLFRFKLQLLLPIKTIESTYCLKDSFIELGLVKEKPGRWHTLVKLSPSRNELPSTSSFDNSINMNLDERPQGQKSQRPTCMVSPLNVEIPPAPVPFTGANTIKNVYIQRPIGRVGLDNMGNTCFMNSIIQVLSNTVDLRDYFLDGYHTTELNTNNQLGMGGKLAIAFGHLIKALWTENVNSVAPSKLKSLVAQKQSRFVGFSQHDAEEFMEFLLDGLHEDLNRILVKPYIADTVECSEGNVKEAADETWRRHKTRNDSLIVDVFQGQYHSKVKCPKCAKVSITFDPFSVVQVPIPNRNRKTIIVHYMSKCFSAKPCRYKLLIDTNGTVEHLKEMLHKYNSAINPTNLRVLEICKSRVVKVIERGTSLSRITSNDLLACEVWSSESVGETVVELIVEQKLMIPQSTPRVCSACLKEANVDTGIVLKRCTRCYKISYCGQKCQREDWVKHKQTCQIEGMPVGWPFVMSFPKSSLTFTLLASTAEACARYSVNVFRPPPSSLDRSRSSIDESPSDWPDPKTPKLFGSNSSLSPSLDETFLSEVESPVVDERASGDCAREVPTRCVLGQQQKPPQYREASFHFRPIYSTSMVLPSYDHYISDEGDKILDLSGVQKLHFVWNNHEKSKNHVLVETKEFDCEEIDFTSEAIYESKTTTLENCLTLFTEPEILTSDQTWFCPRCKVHCQATKEMSLWRLPPALIIHLKRFSFSGYLWRDKIDDFVEFPLRDLDMAPYCRNVNPDENYLYELYAVVNHHGSLLGGHYTAFARCLSDNDPGWRLFDDSHVSSCPESKIVNQSAYVLFYRRCGLQQRSVINHSMEDHSSRAVSRDVDLGEDQSGNLFDDETMEPQLTLDEVYIDEVD